MVDLKSKLKNLFWCLEHRSDNFEMQKTEKLSSSEVTLVLQHHEVPRLSLDLKFKFSSFSIHFSLYSDQMTAVSSKTYKSNEP